MTFGRTWSFELQRINRAGSLPEAMQGRWVVIDEPGSEMVIHDGEITCFGKTVEYDYKEIVEKSGALTVSLKINDEFSEDTFQRANITSLLIDPEGKLYAYNVKFVSRFIRSEGEAAK